MTCVYEISLLTRSGSIAFCLLSVNGKAGRAAANSKSESSEKSAVAAAKAACTGLGLGSYTCAGTESGLLLAAKG